MINLQRTAMFVAVADTGSFTAAAEAMGLTKAVVSFNIRQLEDELGVTLLLRSTRRLTLTEAGRLFHQRSVALLKDAERLKDDVRANHAGLTGELRITTTPEYGSQVVVPLLAEFSQQHPDLRVRHVSSSLHADLISERFDVAIRLGTLADSRYHAALITQFTIFPVATPGWLRNHPVESLEQLAKADWIIHERLASPLRWQVNDACGEPATLEIKKAPRLFADSAQALMAFALAGCGVALLPEWLVRHALDDGTLVSVLPEYTFARQGIYAVYPDAPHVPAKVRTFIDFMRTRVN
ncbi:LysR family transcriptional regulator [Enterobacter ludwigii]|jgi:DNA-binding transcriptional LysR family regulator|uniref:LysR family transcriptional regulator n=1 Tax=Enterobacter TaxID=547 RepID=UPI000643E3E0|nr:MULTISPECIES: LysR family transcriptional regulator [Enterobacter]KLP37045.1 LysR family transcriptional regulator [Enterobacter ludwigii]QLO90364.1 LysR family transcriptional regulator [Enterobacter sp. RHBSTW-00975]WGC19431.1 LysR family transcriptional regulator [Enterobacter ludwigii]HDR2464574.1 LysR family transcriptional regulator [Enterobacter ludwigii]HDS3782924.1 LysR family transcriptional regulator [Enterobacter ludwigii]